MIRRLLAGFGLSTAITLVAMIGQLVAVPLYLSHWGAQVYGEWLTLTSLVANLSLLNLGVQTYVTNRLITSYVHREINAGSRLLHSALQLYTAICAVALCATVAIAAWPTLLVRLNINAIPGSQARLILVIQGLLATYAILGGLLMSLFRVTNQLPRQLAYALVERVTTIFAPLGVAACGGVPVHAAVSVGLLMAAVTSVELRDVKRRSPYPIGFSGASWSEARALIRPSLAFFAVSASTQLLSSVIILVISSRVGAVAVALFTTTIMLSNLVRITINQGMNVLWPEITAAAAQANEDQRLIRWHRLMLKLVGGWTLIATAGLVFFGPQALTLWTRGKIHVDPTLNLVLALYLLVHAPALVSGVFGLATNRQGDMFKMQFTTAGISVLLAIVLTPRFGPLGAAMALLLGQLVGTTWITLLGCRWTSDSLPAFLRQAVLRGLPAVSAVLAIGLGVWRFAPAILGRGIAALGIIIAVALLGWYAWLTGPERALLRAQPGRFQIRERQTMVTQDSRS